MKTCLADVKALYRQVKDTAAFAEHLALDAEGGPLTEATKVDLARACQELRHTRASKLPWTGTSRRPLYYDHRFLPYRLRCCLLKHKPDHLDQRHKCLYLLHLCRHFRA